MGDDREVLSGAIAESEIESCLLAEDGGGPPGTAVALGQAVICRLYAVGLDLAALRTLVDGEVPAEHLERALNELDGSIAEVRRLLYGIWWDASPPVPRIDPETGEPAPGLDN